MLQIATTDSEEKISDIVNLLAHKPYKYPLKLFPVL